jgi:hypothetical protein
MHVAARRGWSVLLDDDDDPMDNCPDYPTANAARYICKRVKREEEEIGHAAGSAQSDTLPGHTTRLLYATPQKRRRA